MDRGEFKSSRGALLGRPGAVGLCGYGWPSPGRRSRFATLRQAAEGRAAHAAIVSSARRWHTLVVGGETNPDADHQRDFTYTQKRVD